LLISSGIRFKITEICTLTGSKLPVVKEQQLDITIIRNNGEIFGDIFIFFRKHLRAVATVAFIIALLDGSLLWIINPNEWRSQYLFSSWSFLNLGNYFNYSSVVLFLTNTLAFAGKCYNRVWLFIREMNTNGNAEVTRHHSFFGLLSVILQTAAGIYYSQFIIPVPAALTWILLPLLFPPVLVWLFAMLYESANPISAIGIIDGFIGESFLRICGLFLILSLVCFILYFFIDSPVIWLFVEVFTWNVILEQDTLNGVYNFIMRFVTLFSMQILLPLAYVGSACNIFH